jgi:hypothetical protein
MKHFILTTALVAMCATTFGQDFRINKVDEFTGDIVKLTTSYRVGKAGMNRLYMSTRRVDDQYGISFWSTLDQGCAGSNGNYVILLDSIGETIRLDTDLSDIDCSDQSISVYALDADEAINFNIAKIRFAQSDSYDDFEYEGEYTLQELIKILQ